MGQPGITQVKVYPFRVFDAKDDNPQSRKTGQYPFVAETSERGSPQRVIHQVGSGEEGQLVRHD
jgi:hypothetical protein